MTRETRHNISIFALGAIILTAAALAEPDGDRARADAPASIAVDRAEQPSTASLDAMGSSAGH